MVSMRRRNFLLSLLGFGAASRLPDLPQAAEQTFEFVVSEPVLPGQVQIGLTMGETLDNFARASGYVCSMKRADPEGYEIFFESIR